MSEIWAFIFLLGLIMLAFGLILLTVLNSDHYVWWMWLLFGLGLALTFIGAAGWFIAKRG
jgi:hypothetical protein